jgi:hypothetical protein
VSPPHPTPPHTHTTPLAGISLAASYPRLRRWVDAIRARPAVQRGLGVPDPNWVTASTGGRRRGERCTLLALPPKRLAGLGSVQ